MKNIVIEPRVIPFIEERWNPFCRSIQATLHVLSILFLGGCIPYVEANFPTIQIEVVSDIGAEINETNCLVAIAIRKDYFWAIPPDNVSLWEGSETIHSVERYRPYMERRGYSSYGMLLGIGVTPMDSIYLIAEGHKMAHFKGFEHEKAQFHFYGVAPPAHPDRSTPPRIIHHIDTEMDAVAGYFELRRIVYCLESLKSEQERYDNIETIRNAFHLDESTRGRLPNRKSARMVRDFLKKEENSLRSASATCR